MKRVETVLVIEDEPLVRAFTVETFRALGCVVFDAYEAESALKVLHLHPEVELVFSDVCMPGRFDGIRLAYLLKQTRPDLMVVLTSAYGPRVSPEFCFMPKPWDERDLEALVAPLPDSSRP
jgi:CheY-like chemotaxis protein